MKDLNTLDQRESLKLPEKTLVARMIHLAASDFILSPDDGKHKKSARKYIFSNKSDWMFSFVRCCEMLGVNAKQVRGRIVELAERGEKPLPLKIRPLRTDTFLQRAEAEYRISQKNGRSKTFGKT